MSGYQKYMFDNFIVSNTSTDTNKEVFDNEIDTSSISEEVYEDSEEKLSDVQTDIIEDKFNEEEVINIEHDEPTYSKEELEAAVKIAEEKSYNEGFAAATEEEKRKQSLLLENIKEQLSSIFMGLDKKSTDIENSALKFAVELLRKILPTLEKDLAEAEVKNFMAQNFTNFASQETLSFAFNPETLSLVADSIGRLAEQNDFEGKISVHKDINLGPTDCRVEWKNGGVERKVSNILNKVEQLIENDIQERENGE